MSGERSPRETCPAAWAFHQRSARIHSDPAHPDARVRRPGDVRENGLARAIELPAPAALHAPLSAVLDGRRSCRRFAPEPIALEALSSVLHAACGHGPGREVDDGLVYASRPAPSAGGLYPIELNVIARRVEGVVAGVHHHASATHWLEEIARGLPEPERIASVFLDQPHAGDAGAIIVLCADPTRTLGKYSERGYRYLLLEAGHLAQCAVLAAGALGLGAVCLGGFHDHELATIVHADPEHGLPLYAVAIGATAGDAADIDTAGIDTAGIDAVGIDAVGIDEGERRS